MRKTLGWVDPRGGTDSHGSPKRIEWAHIDSKHFKAICGGSSSQANRGIQAALELRYIERERIKIALQRRHEARVLEERVRLVASTLPVDGSDSGRSRDGGEESVNAGARTGLSEMVLRVQALLVDEHVWTDHTTDGSAPPVALGVTPREKEIIRGLICYRRLSKVAEVLGISVHTARNHLKSVFRKLDVHSQDDLIRFLLEGR